MDVHSRLLSNLMPALPLNNCNSSTLQHVSISNVVSDATNSKPSDFIITDSAPCSWAQSLHKLFKQILKGRPRFCWRATVIVAIKEKGLWYS